MVDGRTIDPPPLELPAVLSGEGGVQLVPPKIVSEDLDTVIRREDEELNQLLLLLTS